MNIFILHEYPVEAAQLQCDKHVVKMIVESAQMLCTAHRMLDGTQVMNDKGKLIKQWTLNDDRDTWFYRSVHTGHPCTVWTMKTSGNYTWHYNHFVALCDEYTYRYGKVHATDKLLRNALANYPKNIPISYRTPFALAMNSNPECKFIDDPVKSYRMFYQTKQDRFKMVWTKRDVPEWFNKAA